MPKATSLAAAITNDFGEEPQLIRGGGGVFDVEADGELVFSKHQQDRFPDHQEVVDALKAKKS